MSVFTALVRRAGAKGTLELGSVLAAVFLASAPFGIRAAGAAPVGRFYVEVERFEDPAFQAFWDRFRAALAEDARERVTALTAFPIVWGRRCLDERVFLQQYGAVFFTEAVDAILMHPRFVASRNFPGEYYAVIANYRDADEGNEEIYEFSKVNGEFRLTKVGVIDTACATGDEWAGSDAPAAPAAAAAPPASPAPSPVRSNAHRGETAVLLLAIYQAGAFVLTRAFLRRFPRLRWAPLALVGLLIAAATGVGLYLPTRVPSSMWQGWSQALLYVGGAVVLLLALPFLVAGILRPRALPRS